jgi:hypothetical protein
MMEPFTRRRKNIKYQFMIILNTIEVMCVTKSKWGKFEI